MQGVLHGFRGSFRCLTVGSFFLGLISITLVIVIEVSLSRDLELESKQNDNPDLLDSHVGPIRDRKIILESNFFL